jgi:hypothetical protein
MESTKLRPAKKREKKNNGNHLRTQLPAPIARQSHDSMSAEAGPVAHKPLFRVQVSPFLPGGKPLNGDKSFSFGDCTALNQWINPR